MILTQTEKINAVKQTICYLYEKEGRSISYIARLLDVGRSRLSKQIHSWDLVKADAHYLTPSNKKFANKHRQLIVSRYDNDVPETEIAKELGVTRDYLRNIVKKTPELVGAKNRYLKRCSDRAESNIQEMVAKSSLQYDYSTIDNEMWKDILGHSGYQVSNAGRVRNFSKRYKRYYLLRTTTSSRNGRVYITVGDKNYQLARLVALAFVPGHSEENATVDHIDGNVANNKADNLQWVPQSVNNKRAYENGRRANKAYQRNGKFKKIILDNRYEFKTIDALSKFLNVSPTQAQRYIQGECKTSHSIKLVY